MDRVLQKLARQLNQYDDASLAKLWEHYAQIVACFEPTKRWEEAVLSFCMIQAVHWKNQLFNSGMLEGQNMAMQDKELERQLKSRLESLSPAPQGERGKPGAPEGGRSAQKKAAPQGGPQSGAGGGEKQQRRKILIFPSGRNGGKS